MLEIFGRARNHGKKFLKFCQASFSSIVHCGQFESVAHCAGVKFSFWYIAHNWNYGMLAASARTIVKTRRKSLFQTFQYFEEIVIKDNYCLT